MKYHPLTKYLAALPKTTDAVSLEFSEIEAILGAQLPKSASTYAEWWANQGHGSQGPSWISAGFRVDGVDLNLELARFKRADSISAAPRRGSRASKEDTRTARLDKAAMREGILLDAGFLRIADWSLVGGKIHLVGEVPNNSGVYAHVVDGFVFYIGVTKMGLKKRMYFYENPGKTQRTNLRINPLIKQALESGKKVWVLAASPASSNWNGLPVDQVTGLEAGLREKYDPPWNMR